MSFFLPIVLQKYAQNPLNKNLDLNGFKAVNSAEPTVNSDLATKNYVDITAGGGGASSGTLPFSLVAGAIVKGQFTNPTGDDVQFTAPTGTGKLIFTDVHGIDFTNSPSTFTNNSNGICAVFDKTAGTGNTVNISHFNGVGNSLRIDHQGPSPGIDLRSTGTAELMRITKNTNGQTGLLFDTTAGGASDISIIRNGGDSNNINITNSNTSANGISITNNSTASGVPLSINNNGTGSNDTVSINSSKSSGINLNIVNTSTANGNFQPVVINNTGRTTQPTIQIIQNNTTNTSGSTNHALIISQTANNGTTGAGIQIDKLSGGGVGLGININASVPNANGLNIVYNPTAEGIPLNISSASGRGLNVVNSKATGGTNISTNIFQNSGAGNYDVLQLRNDAGSGRCLLINNFGTGDCIQVADTTSDTSLFRVDNDGNVGLGVASGTTLTNKLTVTGDATNTQLLITGTNPVSNVVMTCNAGRIANVADPVNSQDVATRAYVLANAGGTPTSVVNGANRVDCLTSPSETRITGAQKIRNKIQTTTGTAFGDMVKNSYNENTMVNSFENYTNSVHCQEVWQSELTTGNPNDGTNVAMSIKPFMNKAYIGQFLIQDYRGETANSGGILRLVKNSGTHGTIPHLLLTGADSPITNGSVAIACSGAGRITGILPPQATNDAMNSYWGNYTSSNGTKIAVVRNTKVDFITRALTHFKNDASIPANTTYKYGTQDWYPLLYRTTPTSPLVFSMTTIATDNRSHAPVSLFTANPSGSNYVDLFVMNEPGYYRYTVNILYGTVGGTITSNDYFNHTILQDNSTPPTNRVFGLPLTFPACFTRIGSAGHNSIASFTFVTSTLLGINLTIATLGTSFGPNSNHPIATDNLAIDIEYLGPIYQ